MVIVICKREKNRGKICQEEKEKGKRIGRERGSWEMESLTLDLVESENGSFAQQTLHPKVKGYEYKKMDEEEKKERMGCGKVGLLDCDARKVKVSERLTRNTACGLRLLGEVCYSCGCLNPAPPILNPTPPNFFKIPNYPFHIIPFRNRLSIT